MVNVMIKMVMVVLTNISSSEIKIAYFFKYENFKNCVMCSKPKKLYNLSFSSRTLLVIYFMLLTCFGNYL